MLFEDEDEFLDEKVRKMNDNDGKDRRKTKQKNLENLEKTKNKLRKEPKYALRPDTMYFKREDKDVASEYFNRLKKDLLDKYGEFSTAMEIELILLCNGLVRVQRKSRLESFFGRFFDRVASQDPHGQIHASLKALGLLPEKTAKGDNASSDIKQLLAKDSLDAEESNSDVQNFKAWASNPENVPQLVLRTPAPGERPNYTDVDITFEEEKPEKI